MTRTQHIWTDALVSEDGVNGRIAKPGMVLTIRYDATGETETLLLGRRFGQSGDIKVYSTLSPLGHAIVGARPGERRIYSIPNETRPVLVTLLDAVPYGMRGHRDATVAPRKESDDQRATRLDLVASV